MNKKIYETSHLEPSGGRQDQFPKLVLAPGGGRQDPGAQWPGARGIFLEIIILAVYFWKKV